MPIQSADRETQLLAIHQSDPGFQPAYQRLMAELRAEWDAEGHTMYESFGLYRQRAHEAFQNAALDGATPQAAIRLAKMSVGSW